MADEKSNGNGTEQLTPPSWIDAALIQAALHSGGDENAQVVKVSTRLATAPGDNYSSTIYRVKASLADGGERSVLVKGPPPSEMIEQMNKTLGLFRVESYMLAEVIPKMEALLEEAAPGRFPPLAARCPLHGDSPVEFLVIEDLSVPGFVVGDRTRGLGLRHSLLAVRALARFHAASHALLQREPRIMGDYRNMWLSRNEGLHHFLRNAFQSVIDGCSTWPGFEEIVAQLEKHKDDAMRSVFEKCDMRPGTFNVISHGDCWVNNMMFRYDDGEPTESRAVDFQLSFEGSPVLDLLYFFSTSLSEDVSIRHQDLLMREYHHELKETLHLLGLEAPSLGALLADLEEYGAYSLLGAVCVIPIVKAQKTPDVDASLVGEQSAVSYLYETPQLKRWLQRVLPEYQRRGWLDV